MSRQEFDTLYKQCDGKVMEWTTFVEKQRDGTAIIFTRYGYTGGKQQTKKEHVTEGKRKGTKAETDPYQQAVLQAEASWKHQLNRNGYGRTPDQSAAVRKISPMLALEIGKNRSKIDWSNAFAQYKYDGFRCLVDTDGKTIRMRSRKGVVFDTLPHIADAFEGILKPGMIFDGELYRHGWSLNTISSVIGNKAQDKGREELKLYVFDQFGDGPFAERFQPLRDLVPRRHPHIRLAPTVKVSNQGELDYVEKEALENRFEGAILRHGRRGYQAGLRVADVLKVKMFVDDEFKVVDAKCGKGDYENCCIYVCETKDGHHFDVTAEGTLEEKRQQWRDHQKYIGQKLTVKYQRMTATDEPVPFLPVAKGFFRGKKQIPY